MVKIVYDFLKGSDVIAYADSIENAKEVAKRFVEKDSRSRATIYCNDKVALRIYGTSRYCIFA